MDKGESQGRDKFELAKRSLFDDETLPLYDFRIENNYLPVFGEGSLRARMFFIGEAPGESEAKSGRPFQGRAGNLLSEMLSGIGVSRDEVFITNIVKDRPPKNRNPLAIEIEAYSQFLLTEINLVKPEVIITLGQFSTDHIMKIGGIKDKIQPISKIHGERFEVTLDRRAVFLVPMFHPAYALYNGSKKDVLREDFSKLKNYLTD